jgi:hypothetical protein
MTTSLQLNRLFVWIVLSIDVLEDFHIAYRVDLSQLIKLVPNCKLGSSHSTAGLEMAAQVNVQLSIDTSQIQSSLYHQKFPYNAVPLVS